MIESKPKVLVIDEDLLALELYSRELKIQYQIITSESVTEGRRLLRENAFDVLIIEPAMNDDEGWSLLGDVFTSTNPPAVILCSVEDDRKIGLEQGAHAFVVKPVLPSVLHSLLNQIMEKRAIPNPHKMEKGT